MQPSKLLCPHCGAVLRSNKTLVVGQAVECVKCGAPFTVSAADLADTEAPISVIAQAVPQAGEFVLEGAAANGTGPDHVLPEWMPAADDVPRMGLLEGASRSGARPMPQAHRTGVLTAMPAAPPRKPAMALVALGALLVFLAAGATVAYHCWFDTSDDRPEEIAQNNGHALAKEAEHDMRDDATPSRATRSLPSDGSARPAASPKIASRDVPSSSRNPRDLLPAESLVGLNKPAPKAHPERKRINTAIDKGVAYVRSQQAASGSWLRQDGLHAVGYAALPGLTLLECGVKADDPAVQRAAEFVRNPRNVDQLEETYDLALAILFLDRLGESRDKPLIQRLGLRLVAGQNAAGGWDYKCRVLPADESLQLLTYLEQTRPRAALPNPLAKPATGANANPLPGGNGDKLPNPLAQPNPAAPTSPLANQAGPPSVKPKSAGGMKTRPDFLPDFVKKLPIAQAKGKAKGKNLKGAGRDDNSNSQFALLALWAARRHDVPTERTLALAEERYHALQNEDGGWGYRIGNPSGPSMTCVGLLGLAMGHGASDDALLARRSNNRDTARRAKEDPSIQKGLRHLGNYLGVPYAASAKPPMTDLYFLWSVERVAMLYNLPTIGNKDWYSWGVSILLPNQKDNGAWRSTGYPGHGQANNTIDTCFALLFLKRSNLVHDLTENLMLYMAISDPDARR